MSVTKVKQSTVNAAKRGAIHISGNAVFMLWWDFSRGGACCSFKWENSRGGGVGGEGTYWRQWTSKSNFTVDVSRRKKIVLFSEHVSHRLPTPTFTNTSNLRPTRNQGERERNRKEEEKKVTLPPTLTFSRRWAKPYRHPHCTDARRNKHARRKEQSLQHDRTECCLLSRPPPSLPPPTHIRKHQTCLNVCVCFTATNS